MSNDVLDQIFDSIGRCLTAEAATNLQQFRVSDELQTQLDNWADRNLEGSLSAEEKGQYESILRTLNFVAVLQAKAKKIVTEPDGQ